MDPIIKRLRESRTQESEKYKKQVEQILNHQLGSYETGVNVLGVKIKSQTTDTVTLDVEYDVNIRIPYEEDGHIFYDSEVEYRRHTMTLDLKENIGESNTALSPEEMRAELVKDGDYTEEEASKLKGLDLAKAYSELPKRLGESTPYNGYTIKWINDPQGGKHVEVHKDGQFKASYEDDEKAKSAIDSGEVEREDESLELSTGSTFENAGFTWEVLDKKGEYTLVYAAKKKWHPYIVAWKVSEDGSWAQGHYFSDEDEARAYLNKKG